MSLSPVNTQLYNRKSLPVATVLTTMKKIILCTDQLCQVKTSQESESTVRMTIQYKTITFKHHRRLFFLVSLGNYMLDIH